MATKMYDLSGVDTLIEFGKQGYIFQYDSANGWMEVLQSDGSTLGRLQIAEPQAASDGATKNYVDVAISGLIDSAPGTLDTLNEIAAALNDDPDFYNTINNLINEIDANVDDLVTLSGVAENSTDLGTFTGTTISDSSTVKAALQELETAHEALDGEVTTLSATVAAIEHGCRYVEFDFEDGTPVNIGMTIPADMIVTGVRVRTDTAWDDSSSSIKAGITGDDDLLFNTFKADLTTAGMYMIDKFVKTTAETQFFLTLNHGTSVQGSGAVLLEYCPMM